LFSRRLLGYAMSEHHDAALTVASLQMAVATRGGAVDGVVFHSDRGSEGGFNRSSQHLDLGGVDGSAIWMDAGVDGAVTDEVAGRSSASAGDRAGILARDREGASC
ncbi:hypothetical protein AB0G16_38720, partial [Streptosporangium sp. NPDC023615]